MAFRPSGPLVWAVPISETDSAETDVYKYINNVSRWVLSTIRQDSFNERDTDLVITKFGSIFDLTHIYEYFSIAADGHMDFCAKFEDA